MSGTWGFPRAAGGRVRGPLGVTERYVVHIVATAVRGIALFSALVLGAFVHGPRFRVYSCDPTGQA